MRQVLLESQQRYWARYNGQTLEVLWESSRQVKDGQWALHGLTRNYLPVSATGTEDRWNSIDSVKITNTTQDSLIGVLL
jgi:tRNA A37 methylthiotransferase MiaB